MLASVVCVTLCLYASEAYCSARVTWCRLAVVVRNCKQQNDNLLRTEVPVLHSLSDFDDLALKGQ